MGGGTGRDRETARQEGAAAGRLAAKKFDGLHRRLSWPEFATRPTLSWESSPEGIVVEKLSSVPVVPQAAGSPRSWSIAALIVGAGQAKIVRNVSRRGATRSSVPRAGSV